jgi:hypothetical protein
MENLLNHDSVLFPLVAKDLKVKTPDNSRYFLLQYSSKPETLQHGSIVLIDSNGYINDVTWKIEYLKENIGQQFLDLLYQTDVGNSSDWLNSSGVGYTSLATMRNESE